MIERQINRAFNAKIFNKIYENYNYSQKLHSTSLNFNEYVDYLNDLSTPFDFDKALKTISYNTSTNARCWNYEPLEYCYYDEHMRQRLPQELCVRIKASMNDIYKERVCQIMRDYHILLDVNDNPVDISLYPEIWFGIGYFETFPISYFESFQMTDQDITDIADAVNERAIITNNESVVTVYKIDVHHQVKQYSFNKNEGDRKRLLLKIILCLVSTETNTYQSLINQLENMSEDVIQSITRYL